MLKYSLSDPYILFRSHTLIMTSSFFSNSYCALKLRTKLFFFASNSLMRLESWACYSLLLSTCMRVVFFISSILIMSISFSCLISLYLRITIVKSRESFVFYFYIFLVVFSLQNLDLFKRGSMRDYFSCWVTNMLRFGMLLWFLSILDYCPYFNRKWS